MHAKIKFLINPLFWNAVYKTSLIIVLALILFRMSQPFDMKIWGDVEVYSGYKSSLVVEAKGIRNSLPVEIKVRD